MLFYSLWFLLTVALPSFIYSLLFPLEKEGKASKVTFYQGGIKRFFYLPPPKQVGERVYLVKKGKIREITQPGGYPLLVTANDLEAEEIIIEDLEGEENRFSGDTFPYLYS